MAALPHVWLGWVAHSATHQKNRCVRCGAVIYRRYPIQPS